MLELKWASHCWAIASHCSGDCRSSSLPLDSPPPRQVGAMVGTAGASARSYALSSDAPALPNEKFIGGLIGLSAETAKDFFFDPNFNFKGHRQEVVGLHVWRRRIPRFVRHASATQCGGSSCQAHTARGRPAETVRRAGARQRCEAAGARQRVMTFFTMAARSRLRVQSPRARSSAPRNACGI